MSEGPQSRGQGFGEQLIALIEDAFAEVQYPGDDRLTDSTYGEEPAALAEDFRGRTDWRELDVAFLNQAPDGWGTALSFFSAAALRFYLPAYLIADIRGELECGGPESRLCTFLTPQAEGQKVAKVWGGGTMGEHSRADFADYNAKQVCAVVAYLWWKLDASGGLDPTIEQALEHYWLVREQPQRDGGKS